MYCHLCDYVDICDECKYNQLQFFADMCWYCSNGNCFSIKEEIKKEYKESPIGAPSCDNFMPFSEYDMTKITCSYCRYRNVCTSAKSGDFVEDVLKKYYKETAWFYE